MKTKKIFEYKKLKLKIVEREESFLNSREKVTVLRVIAPNGGVLPVSIKHKQTLKSIVCDAIATLDNFEKMGANVIHELTKKR